MPTCIGCHTAKEPREFRPPGMAKGGRRNICWACYSGVPTGHKMCSKCGAVKVLDDFYPHTQANDGKQPECKACSWQTKLASQQRHPERHRARQQRNVRRSHVLRKYGLPREAYEQLVVLADGKCMACGQPERVMHRDGTFWDLCVDHDHETGAVRGLVCHDCNRAMGYAGDDPARLRQLADYLEARS